MTLQKWQVEMLESLDGWEEFVSQPMEYEEAVRIYDKWARQQPGTPQQPNVGLSEYQANKRAWLLKNVNGVLATVSKDGTVAA